ncbi:MAG: ATP-binding cassette domain-containing protein [Mucilaginibacter polytrichastri]|nr:ATP-binding cassette domain-containing protein [Mucilaginibacter polytrichastri]
MAADNTFFTADSIELAFGGRRILNGFALQGKAGEIIGLLGRNGSGKSTLLKVLFGSLRPGYQHIRINDVIIKKGYRKQHIAYLPQENFIPAYLDVRQIGRLYDRADFITACADFAVPDDQPLNSLSGGQQRIVEILLIVHSAAQVILLDEPFSQLALVLVEKMGKYIRAQASQRQKCFVLTDHLYAQLIEVVDRLLLLHNGAAYAVKDNDDLIRFGYLPSNFSG